ncbi:MAG: hypothetical protein LUO93_05940 [Methanomicrobiales archaeon]|nr:hypothetical protein [Methanomicrobiales archaeon]
MTIANLGFCVALIPTLLEGLRTRQQTVPLTSSLVTAGLLSILVVAFGIERYWFATGASAATTLVWSMIALQRFAYGPPRKYSLPD